MFLHLLLTFSVRKAQSDRFSGLETRILITLILTLLCTLTLMLVYVNTNINTNAYTNSNAIQ